MRRSRGGLNGTGDAGDWRGIGLSTAADALDGRKGARDCWRIVCKLPAEEENRIRAYPILHVQETFQSGCLRLKSVLWATIARWSAIK